MNESQRSQIRDNANYLRQVRPIDPEEIYEYVEGTPHPGVVREVLREQAPDLDLIEREDGSFEPVDHEPVSVSFSGVDSLPDRLCESIEEQLEEQYGTEWPDGRSGELLRTKIRDFKRRYLRGEVVTYDTPTALGYAIYHLPSYFAAIQYVFADMASDGLLGDRLRILDVGAGVGGPALGIDALVPTDSLVEYHAVEPSAATVVLERLLEATGRNVHPTIHQQPIEQFQAEWDTARPFDVILFANVLSELVDPDQVLSDLLDVLAESGTMVALAPADRNTGIQLRQRERTLERQRGATVYAPTVRLWPDEKPESESWSFRRNGSLAVPSFQRLLDEGERTERENSRATDPGGGEHDSDGPIQPAGSGEFVNVDVQYAFSLLRTDGKQAVEFRPDPETTAKMAGMDDHVTDRIDCVGIKLSHDLAEDGNPLFLVGDGSQRVDHFAVLADASTLNRDLETAAYGDVLAFENVLVLWNEDEQAYNLVVDAETVVDRLPL